MNESYLSFFYGILCVMQAKSISINVHSAFILHLIHEK